MPVVQPTVAPAAPTSLIASPTAVQEAPIPGVGDISDQERFQAVLKKVSRDAARENLAAAQAEDAGAADAAEPAAAPEAAEAVVADAAEADDAEADEADDAEAEPAKPAAGSRDLAKLKALLAADPAAGVEALETALGKDAIKALKLDSKQWAAFRHEKKQFRAAHAEREAQLEQIHGRLSEFHASLQPLAAAKVAFDDGDYQKAHELAFGMDVNEFQKRALRQKQGEDPKVAKLERELAEERRVRETDSRQKQEAEQARAYAAAEAGHLKDIAEELSSSDDPVMASAGKLPDFAAQVLEIQRDHFDRQTKSTIPIITAAEMALEKFREAHDRWAAVFASLDQGDIPEQSSDRAAPARTAAQKTAKSKAAPTAPARPKRSLTQSTATEAAGPGRALTPDEIYAKHLREMQKAANEELAHELG